MNTITHLRTWKTMAMCPRSSLVMCLALFHLHLIPLLLESPLATQHVRMFDFSLYFLVGLHSAGQMSQICLYIFI